MFYVAYDASRLVGRPRFRAPGRFESFIMFGSLDLRGKAQTVSGMVVVAVLVVVSLLYLTVTMQRSIIVYDEGLMLFGAERVLNGDVPHRDFYAIYGPAQFYLLAGLYKLFGASVLIERALDTVERCACVVLVFVIVDRAAPRLHAILAATASLIWLQYFGAYGYPLFPALAAALAGLAFLMSTFQGAGSASGLIAGGVCAGVVVLFRYDVGVPTFVAEGVLLALIPAPVRSGDPAPGTTSGWVRLVFTSYHMRTVARRLLMFGLGFAVVTVPVGVVFAVYGVIPDLLFDVFTAAGNYVRMRAMPFPRPAALWANPSEFGVYLPLVLCAAALPTITALAGYRRGIGDVTTDRRSSTSLLVTLVVLVVMTLVLYSKDLVHVSALFVSMGLITSLILAAVLAQPVRGRGWFNDAVVMTALSIGGVATLCNVPKALHEALGNFEWVRDPASWEVASVPPELGSCRMPAGLERIACFKVRQDRAETVLYVQQRTVRNDPVYVGLTGHDKIFGNDILIYFLLNRPSATKWHQFDPGMQTTALIQERMIDELRGVKPKLIVLEKWGELTDPNESSVSSGVTLLDDYIRQTYEPVATFGANTILRGRTP